MAKVHARNQVYGDTIRVVQSGQQGGNTIVTTEYTAGQAWPANGFGSVLLAPSGGILTVVPLSAFGGGGGGDATAANQATQITAEQAIQALLAAGLPAALGANGGLKVDGSGVALPISGNIGTVTLLTGTTTLTPGTGATNLGKATDNPAGGNDVGIAILGKRVDTPATITPANGDWAQFTVDSQGALYVNAGLGPAQYTEDAVSTGGESLNLMGAVRRDTAASSSNADGDYSTLNTDPVGRLRTLADTTKSGTNANTSVASSATSVSLLAANVNRTKATIFNDSTAVLYLRLEAAAASLTAYHFQIAPGAAYVESGVGLWTGEIRGIWASANGNARVNELTA